MKALKGFILAATFAAAPFARADYITGTVQTGTGGAAGIDVGWYYSIDTASRCAEITGLYMDYNSGTYDPDTGEPIYSPEGTCLYLTIPESIELPAGSDYPELNGSVGPFAVTSICSGAFCDLNFYQQYASSIEFDLSYAPLVTIGQGAFASTGGSPVIRLSPSASFPATLKRIEDEALAGMNWDGVSPSLPAGLEYIGYRAFGGAMIGDVDDKGVYWLDGWAVAYNYSDSVGGTPAVRGQLDLSTGKGIAAGVFENETRIRSVILPSGITTIPQRAFAGCTMLGAGNHTITIPASVTTIEDAAFQNCSNLTNFVFEGNAPTVGQDSFSNVGATSLSGGRSPIATVQPGTTGWGIVPGGVWNVFLTMYAAEPLPPTYTVTWKNDDGTVLERDTGLSSGATPTYNGAGPYKAQTPQYFYLFDGWTPAIEAVVSNTTYTAVYTPFVKSYAVTWLDEDGSQIDLLSYHYGDTPSHAAPSKAAEAPYTYTFAGWSPAIAPVTEATSYTATYTRAVDLSLLTGNWTAADGDVLTNGTGHVVSIPAGATVTINGVTIVGAGGGAVGPAAFAADGEAITAGIAQGANGKWTLTAFAELEDGTAEGLADSQVKVVRADSPQGLGSATPMENGVTVKEKKNAVKVELEVETPAGAPAQFFKVRFGE